MNTKQVLLTCALAIGLGSAWAQGPNGSGTYYSQANGKKGQALKTALGGIINTHTNIGYDGLYSGYVKTDTREDGYVRDWYSTTTHYTHNVSNKGNYSKEGDMYNREHSVPQSWFEGGSSQSIIKADIVHVVPTDGYVNNRRGNYPLAEVSSVTYQSNGGYCKLGSCKTDGYTGTVFEPNDETKGDFARMYFYMATCYETESKQWGHNVFSSQNQGFESWYLDMLLRWAQQDPIDAVEIARNNAVYEVQGNRNPFVDYPGLEDYIWGNKKDQPFLYDNFDGGETSYVAMPMFSPEAGSYYQSVDVTLTTATADADIYYTTDGADASEQSILYDGPFTLTETATIKAVAIKDGNLSTQATATYTITDQDPEQPIDGQIGLNNTLFATNYSGSITGNDDDLKGTANGVTVAYSKASGSYRYCNSEQIRLYPGNTLTLSVQQDAITQLQFVFADGTPSRDLAVGTTSLSDGQWTGEAQKVTVTFDGSKHARLTAVAVKTKNNATAITLPTSTIAGQRVVYNLQGQRVLHPSHGVYIVDGKKVLLP